MERLSSPELPVDPGVPPGVDVDLAALPPPPRRTRTFAVALLGAAAILAAAVSIALLGDVRFALASDVPVDLGELAHADLQGALADKMVRGNGAIDPAAAVHFSRPFETDDFALAPVVGNPRLWIELRIPEESKGRRAAPLTSFVGRLGRLEQGWLRYRGLASAVPPAALLPPADAWVLVDGEVPHGAAWAIPLAALFGVFAAYGIFSILRILRPLVR
jgi:hypothetical protein